MSHPQPRSRRISEPLRRYKHTVRVTQQRHQRRTLRLQLREVQA